MAIFNDTPPLPFRAALSKYRVRLAALLLQPVGALVLSYLVPALASHIALAWLGVAASANLWVAAVRDAPFKYLAVGCVAWFATSVLCLAFIPGASVGA